MHFWLVLLSFAAGVLNSSAFSCTPEEIAASITASQLGLRIQRLTFRVYVEGKELVKDRAVYDLIVQQGAARADLLRDAYQDALSRLSLVGSAEHGRKREPLRSGGPIPSVLVLAHLGGKEQNAILSTLQSAPALGKSGRIVLASPRYPVLLPEYFEQASEVLLSNNGFFKRSLNTDRLYFAGRANSTLRAAYQAAVQSALATFEGKLVDTRIFTQFCPWNETQTLQDFLFAAQVRANADSHDPTLPSPEAVQFVSDLLPGSEIVKFLITQNETQVSYAFELKTTDGRRVPLYLPAGTK